MGVVALVGLKNAVGFFMRESKIKGSIFFFAGFLTIMIGWRFFTLIGFLGQLWGIFLLFRSFIGTILIYGQSLPIIGGFLRSDTVKSAVKIIESAGDGKRKAKFEV
jgi:hypothetical protein